MGQLGQHEDDGAELLLGHRVPAHVEVPGQERRGERVGAAAGALDQDGPGHERLARLVAAQHRRPGQPELLGEVPAQARWLTS